MSFYVYNDTHGVGRCYWNDERRQWVMSYEQPTPFATIREAENVIATFVLLHPNLMAQQFGVVEESKVGKL